MSVLKIEWVVFFVVMGLFHAMCASDTPVDGSSEESASESGDLSVSDLDSDSDSDSDSDGDSSEDGDGNSDGASSGEEDGDSDLESDEDEDAQSDGEGNESSNQTGGADEGNDADRESALDSDSESDGDPDNNSNDDRTDNGDDDSGSYDNSNDDGESDDDTVTDDASDDDTKTDSDSDAGGNSDSESDESSDVGENAGEDVVGPCNRPVGSCTAPEVTVTEIDVGIPVTGYGREGDTEPLPLAIAAMPSGGSRLAWLGTDSNVYVAKLDCDDQMVGEPAQFPGVNLQDIHADDDGGVVLLTRDATNGGTDNCGGGTLCGGESSPCRAMYMVRFGDSGNVEWETQVTNLSDSLAGYDDGARFVWWYQHHGRLAFDGSSYAAYFCIGITVNNGGCVDIHEGDRMQVVGGDGAPVSHPDAFEVGCSHSWGTRMVWDPRTGHFVMVCATDNNCRIAQPNPYRTIASGECDGSLFGGDLVLASDTGYWTAWSQGGQIRLEHFSTGASDQTIANAGPSSHPHLVSYGEDNMLLSWESGSGMTAQVRSAGDGSTIGSEFTIDVPDHDFQAFKGYPDGSAAYPAAGTTNTSIRIARVLPCS